MIGHVKSWKLGSVHSLYDISVISGTKHRATRKLPLLQSRMIFETQWLLMEGYLDTFSSRIGGRTLGFEKLTCQ